MQDRMDELLRAFIKTLVLLENQHDGLLKFVYTAEVKAMEIKMNQMYQEGNFTGFVLALNNMRNAWMNGLTKFTQMEFEQCK